MKLEIMTPVHSKWNEFFSRLEGPEGCNFVERIPGDLNSITWSCDSSYKRPLSRSIMEKIGNIDIEKTMDYFDNHGGHCDCEIIFNCGV